MKRGKEERGRARSIGRYERGRKEGRPRGGEEKGLHRGEIREYEEGNKEK